MPGDRDQCLEAGMDGYVSKPVKTPELLSAIEAVIAGSRAALPTTTTTDAPQQTPETPADGSIDLGALLAGFGGRSDLVRQVIDVFIDDAPAMLTQLKEAARAGEAAKIATAAHAVKGSVGLFSQGDAYQRARALEQRARSGDGSDALTAAAEIEAGVNRLTTELRGVREKLSG
jgi:HPt (histidine-containing phosphotransfer) domain-containing protein